ncbi:hypothetical protein GGI12_000046 [Dipsacomyces acuminosporus]|nr:hypothetical protein GGI12_000046 [Dipsacomyces acuminosporus]
MSQSNFNHHLRHAGMPGDSNSNNSRPSHSSRLTSRYSPSATGASGGSSSIYDTYYADSIISDAINPAIAYGYEYQFARGANNGGNNTGANSDFGYGYSNYGYGATAAPASTNHTDSDKAAAFQHRQAPYSRASSSSLPVYSSSNDPFVQTDNRLKEEYSRRVHCYISEMQEDGSMPADDILPPVLPSFGSLPSQQELPFWRPPAVLQRDPHYNNAISSATTPSPTLLQPPFLSPRTPEIASSHQNQWLSAYYRDGPSPIMSPHRDTFTAPSAAQAPTAADVEKQDTRSKGKEGDSGSFSLTSPQASSSSSSMSTLPALRNLHHNQQQQLRHTHPHNTVSSQSTFSSTAMPTVNSLLSSPSTQSHAATALPSIHSLTNSSSTAAPAPAPATSATSSLRSRYSRRIPGIPPLTLRTRPGDFVRESNGEGLAVDDGEDEDDDEEDDGTRAATTTTTTNKAYGGMVHLQGNGADVKLPPINTQGGNANGPFKPLEKSREPMSISSLVGRATPESTGSSTPVARPTVQRSKRGVCLPGISSLAPSASAKEIRRGAIAPAPGHPAVQLYRPAQPATTTAASAKITVTGNILAPTAVAPSKHAISKSELIPKSDRKRSYDATDAALSLHKMARTEPAGGKSSSASSSSLCRNNQVVITCYHASVAQKSYGGEKRFLCPPPAVLMRGEGHSAHVAHHSPMLLSVVTDTSSAAATAKPSMPQGQDQQQQYKLQNGPAKSSTIQPSSSSHAPLECQMSFNERNTALFKSLHVTGMQKAKSFRLRLDLLTPSGASGQMYSHEHKRWQGPEVYASLESDSVAIISKPSKKTAKARNQSSCIRAGSLISLFNRINSQTFRTKYLNVDHNTNRWVAQSHNWSPFEVVVVSTNGGASSMQQQSNSAATAAAAGPLYYGSEIVLVEPRRNFRSPPMIIHKVERGKLVENACSPVSQMQKVALQLKPTVEGEVPRYLKSDVGHYSPMSGDSSAHVRFDDPDGSPELTFEPIEGTRLTKSRSRDAPFEDSHIDLDDFFCWTIVGISGFTYSYSIPAEQKPSDSCGVASLRHPRPSPICNINPLPRIVSTPTISGNAVQLSMQSFDPTSMELLLNNLPLRISANADAVGSENHRHHHLLMHQQQSAKPAGYAGKNATIAKDEAGDLFVAYLPEPLMPGLLSIRRSDGVLYSTKWRVQWSSLPNRAEIVADSLVI